MSARGPLRHSCSALAAIIILMAFVGCGSPEEQLFSEGTWNPQTPTIYEDYSTPIPSVTPGGVLPGYDGVIIEGTLVITGAAHLETDFRFPEYGDPTHTSCSA